MLWDDEFFYFAFACDDPDMWSIYDQEDDKYRVILTDFAPIE